MGLIIKLLQWIPLNAVSVLGVAQGVMKVLKEVLTAVVNVLFPLIPNAKFQDVVNKVRGFCNVADGWIEEAKSFLLKMRG
jgi:hypothetical protein